MVVIEMLERAAVFIRYTRCIVVNDFVATEARESLLMPLSSINVPYVVLVITFELLIWDFLSKLSTPEFDRRIQIHPSGPQECTVIQSTMML